jgi:hypothetical protein
VILARQDGSKSGQFWRIIDEGDPQLLALVPVEFDRSRTTIELEADPVLPT